MASGYLARRNELARERGFRNYYEQRQAVEFANKSKQFRQITGGKAGGRGAHSLQEAHLFYQAFKQGDRDDYRVRTRNGQPVVVVDKSGKPHGAKARWIIEVAGYVEDTDEWKRRYPRGRRD